MLNYSSLSTPHKKLRIRLSSQLFFFYENEFSTLITLMRQLLKAIPLINTVALGVQFQNEFQMNKSFKPKQLERKESCVTVPWRKTLTYLPSDFNSQQLRSTMYVCAPLWTFKIFSDVCSKMFVYLKSSTMNAQGESFL